MAVLISLLIGVVGFVAAYVFNLQSRNRSLSNQVGQAQAENKLVETLTKESIAHEDTESAEEDYNAFRATILKPDGGEGGSEPGSTVH